jgi:hypothetical protein
MRIAAQQAARHLYATGVLLSDGIKPIVAVWSDDFFCGYEEIKLFDDTIQKGLDGMKDDTSDGVSDELMSAMRDSQ